MQLPRKGAVKLLASHLTEDREAVDRLLREAHVVTTPGAGFGAAGEGYVRISAFNSRENVEEAIARIKRKYPEVAVLKRPSNRPFATYGAHDPEGNYFDLTQEGMSNRRDVYVEQQREQPRRVQHLKLRVMNPAKIAAFYRDSFDFAEAEKALEDPNYYLTDGRVTLIVAPWMMSDFEGAGIERPGLEHVGFRVESVEAVKKELAALRESNPDMRERIVSEASEGERRLALIASCRHGRHQCSSPDGVFIDILDG
jgi:hypothetical protein